MGRPKATAPRGRVTPERAAELSGLSRSAVFRRIAAQAVPSRTEPDGTVTIALRDVRRLQPQQRGLSLSRSPVPAVGRRAVMLRPDIERYEAWARAAGGKPVSTWLAELADRAVARAEREGVLPRH